MIRSPIACLLLLCATIPSVTAAPEHAKPTPWGPEKTGVRTRLVALADAHQLGKPMQFRLEMKNVSDQVVHYDSQGIGVHDSLSVVSAAGEAVPFVGGWPQTVGGERPLKPGETVVLCPRIDISTDYLVTLPNTYTVKFRGRGPAFGTVWFPPSNALEVKVAKGTVSPARSAAGKLIGILPDERWDLSVRGNSITVMYNPTGLKADVLHLTLEVFKGWRKKGEKDQAGLVPLGRKDPVRVYLGDHSDAAKLGKAWEGYRQKIVEALGLVAQ